MSDSEGPGVPPINPRGLMSESIWTAKRIAEMRPFQRKTDASGVPFITVRPLQDGNQVSAEYNEMLDQIALLIEQRDRLLVLMRDLTDEGECWFDHHGGCQEHGYLSLKPGELCPHAEAKVLWAELSHSGGDEDDA